MEATYSVWRSEATLRLAHGLPKLLWSTLRQFVNFTAILLGVARTCFKRSPSTLRKISWITAETTQQKLLASKILTRRRANLLKRWQMNLDVWFAEGCVRLRPISRDLGRQRPKMSFESKWKCSLKTMLTFSWRSTLSMWKKLNG